jgi:hypothetical protein
MPIVAAEWNNRILSPPCAYPKTNVSPIVIVPL